MKNDFLSNKKGISLFSTYALDRIIEEKGDVIREQLGGPLPYLKNALDNIKIDSTSFFGEKIKVEIRISDKGEFGRIITFPKVNLMPQNISGDWHIISTVFNEWDTSIISKLKGRIFLDIQGYVREGNNFGKKKLWNDIEKFCQKVFCLKGTKEEIAHIPKNVFEDQKKRLLIITDGAKGVEWFDQKKYYRIEIKKGKKPQDTIGAGDTFFGYFVGFLYKGKTVKSSINLAIKKTEKFLLPEERN